MRTITLENINDSIERNRKDANLNIRLTASTGRKKKSRVRVKGEVEALNQISIARWKKAVQQGKIKVLGKRVLYYDYN